ncbi:MAG: hypothetical protein Q4A59_02155 [Erysipelotrichaceae bacterium]|nr:hypothetical protein [Erysipelotrichaceae bacterium]
MFVQLVCKNCNPDKKDEIYQTLGALSQREGVQIEDRGHAVEIFVCPQGKITVQEDENDVVLAANTRHGGPGFHAFVVDFFEDLQEEVEGEYELFDDTEYNKDEDFDRLIAKYEEELEYVRKLILDRPGFSEKNYMFDETYYLPQVQQGKINTATGTMDLTTFQTTNIKHLMDRFYVWNDWDRDGQFYLNSALTLIAKDYYGQYSMMDEVSEKIAQTIADDIEVAYRLNPLLPMPLQTYGEICDMLHRDRKLKGAIAMEEEIMPYRNENVHHIFEDARIVALGSAQRNYDPITQSLFLSAPYQDEGEWSWLIQASLQPDILSNVDELLEREPYVTQEQNVIWMDEYAEDGIQYIDAIIREDERYLYVHALAQEFDRMDYLRKCILQSGFYHA